MAPEQLKLRNAIVRHLGWLIENGGADNRRICAELNSLFYSTLGHYPHPNLTQAVRVWCNRCFNEWPKSTSNAYPVGDYPGSGVIFELIPGTNISQGFWMGYNGERRRELVIYMLTKIDEIPWRDV